MIRIILFLYRKFRLACDFVLKTDLNKYELKGNLNHSTLKKIKLAYTLELPFTLGRTIRGIGFNNHEKDLYSKIVFDLLDGGQIESIIDSLYSVYTNFKNHNINDSIRFLKGPKFKSLPLWAIVNPWDSTNLENNRAEYLNSFYKNRSENNLMFSNSSKIHIESMIYSRDTAKSQVIQFNKLLKKIIKQGYKQNYNDLPTAIILIKKNKWTWMMNFSGNHRAHIVKELGFKSLRFKITGIVDFNNLSNFNNVINGDYSKNEAELLFNRVFNGEIPIRGPI